MTESNAWNTVKTTLTLLCNSPLLTTLGVNAPKTRIMCLDDPMDSDQDYIARHELLETIQKMNLYIFYYIFLSSL